MVTYEYDSYYRPIKWCEDWKEFDDEHRDDLFHWRVGIQERVCSVIIDQNAWGELVSTELIEKLHLPVIEHPHPYTLPWFVDGGEFQVTKQALISVHFGAFSCETLCDVVPMRIHHLFLGNLWLQQWHAEYFGKRRRINLHVNGKRLRLISLTQRETFDMQRVKELRISAIGDPKISCEDFSCPIVEEVCPIVREVVHKDEPLVEVLDNHRSDLVDVHVEEEEKSDFQSLSVCSGDIPSPLQVHDDPSLESGPELLNIPNAAPILHTDVLELVGLDGKLKGIQAAHTYSDPFLMHFNLVDYVVADFCEAPICLGKRMLHALFPSTCFMVFRQYEGLLTYVRPRLLFDPGGFEDESFRTGRE